MNEGVTSKIVEILKVRGYQQANLLRIRKHGRVQPVLLIKPEHLNGWKAIPR